MLRSSFYSIVPLILTWTSAALADFEGKILTNNIGCDISGLTLSKGFSANFYSYSYEDTSDYTNSNFYLNGAYSQSLITTAKFIDPNFVYTQDATTTATAEYWGVNLPITNFAADFYGYFYAEYTGIYSFEMVNVDEAAMVWVGAGGLDCCNPSVEQLGSADTAIMLATKDWQSTSSNQESWVYLEAGYYYPIKIVYVNIVSNGALDFQVTDPEGHTENIMNNVYQLQGSIKGEDCSSVWASATSSWETYTYFDTNMVPGSTVSSPASSTNSKGEVVTYIDATVGVGSFVSTTETSYWTKTEVGYSTTTVAQYYDGTTNAVEIVYVLRPVLSTSVSTWSNGWINYSTYSDATTTYVVEYLPPMNTKYTEWGSDSYSTTTVTTSIEWQGNTTYVQIYGPTLSTSYVFPEGQQGTNTYTKTMTYSDGSTSDIVVVQLPQAPTTYIPWTSTGTTTYTSTWSESGKAPSEQVIIRGPSRTTVYVTDSTNYITTATGVVTTNSAGETVTMDIIYDHQNIQTVVSFGTQFTKLTTFTSTGINADWQTGTYVYIEGPIPTNIVTTQAPVYNVQTSYFWSATASGTAPTTGSWNAVVYVPYYQTTYVQWDKSYETEIVSYTNLGWTTTAFNVKYVPSYSVSYSYWDKTYKTTVTIESSIKEGFSYKPTTYVYIQAPQPRIVTSTWEETYSTTVTTYATFSSDGSLFTSSEIIVQVPGTKVVKPWTTIVVSNYECDGTGIATSVVGTTIDGISTEVGIEYQTVLANTCYPDSSTSSSEGSNSISSSSSTSYESSGSITALSSTYSVSSASSYVSSTSSSKSSDSGFALPTSTLINTQTCGTVTYTTTVTEELVVTGAISSGKVTGTSTYVLVVEEIPDTSCFESNISTLSLTSSESSDSSFVLSSTSAISSSKSSNSSSVSSLTSSESTGSSSVIPSSSSKSLDFSSALSSPSYASSGSSPVSSSTSSKSSDSGSAASAPSYASSGSSTALSFTSSKSSYSSHVLSTSSSKSSDSGFALPTSTLINFGTCGSETYTTTVTKELVATGAISSGTVTGTSTYVLVVEETPAAGCFELIISTSSGSTDSSSVLSTSSSKNSGSNPVSSSTSSKSLYFSSLSSAPSSESTGSSSVISSTSSKSLYFSSLSSSTSSKSSDSGSASSAPSYASSSFSTASSFTSSESSYSSHVLSTSSSKSSDSGSASSAPSYASSSFSTASSFTSSESSYSSHVLSTSSSKSLDSGFALPTSTLINSGTCGTVTYTTTVTKELVATGAISSGTVTGTSTYVLVVEETPAASCFKPLLSNSVSSLTTYLSVSLATSKPSSVVSTSTSTPASSDYAVFTTTETAFDCHFTSYTTNIGTTDSIGRYMNATLVIFETPASTCLDIPTFTTVLPAPDCKETTFTSFTSTLKEFSSSVSAVLVVVKTKPASCEVSAPTYVLSTTVVTATDCEATTVTLHSTTFGSDGQTTIFDNVVITKAADTCTENQQSSTTQESSSSDISAASQVTSTATVESYVTSTIYCTRCHHTIYTTVGTTVTDGITVTTTECVEKTPIYEITSTVQTSADNHSLPLTTYTTVVDNITKTVTEPCSDSNTVPTSSALGDSDETSGLLSNLRPTTTSLITVTTDATPNINFTTYTTVSNDVTITVTKPCSETNSPESLSSETSEVAPESVVTPMSYTTDAVSETLSASTPGVTGATPTNGFITYTTVSDDTTITVTRPCSESNSDKTGSSASETQSALYSSASSATVLEVNNISSSVSVNPATSVFTTQPGYSLPASMMTISNSSSTYPAAEPTVSIYNGGAGKLYPGLGSVAVILVVALL